MDRTHPKIAQHFEESDKAVQLNVKITDEQLIQTWDAICSELGSKIPELGPRGNSGVDLYELARQLLSVKKDIMQETSKWLCCDHSQSSGTRDVVWTLSKKHWANHPHKLGGRSNKTVTEWLNAAHLQQSDKACVQCNHKV